jgi:hypothetical protein
LIENKNVVLKAPNHHKALDISGDSLNAQISENQLIRHSFFVKKSLESRQKALNSGWQKK